MKKIENFEIFQQKSNDDCWIASSKMVLDFLGKTIDYNNLIKKANLIKPSDKGSGEGIVKLLSEYDLKYSSQLSIKVGGDLEDNSARTIIETSINSNFPVIIGLDGHAVVVIGYFDDGIIIANPYNKKEETIIYKDLIFGDICYKKTI